MPLPAGLEVRANNAITALATALSTYQASYAAAHSGRLWQGLRTHPATPTGADTAFDRSRKPTDQAEDWTDIPIPNSIPVSFEVHVHQTPDGWGHTIIARVRSAGDVYIKRAGSGFGATTHDWQLESGLEVAPQGGRT